MSKPHASECHTSQREKMEKISGHADNFESRADKAHRMSDGYAAGGSVPPVKTIQPPPPPKPDTQSTRDYEAIKNRNW